MIKPADDKSRLEGSAKQRNQTIEKRVFIILND